MFRIYSATNNFTRVCPIWENIVTTVPTTRETQVRNGKHSGFCVSCPQWEWMRDLFRCLKNASMLSYKNSKERKYWLRKQFLRCKWRQETRSFLQSMTRSTASSPNAFPISLFPSTRPLSSPFLPLRQYFLFLPPPAIPLLRFPSSSSLLLSLYYLLLEVAPYTSNKGKDARQRIT